MNNNQTNKSLPMFGDQKCGRFYACFSTTKKKAVMMKVLQIFV
jgi:hypothetical protein